MNFLKSKLTFLAVVILFITTVTVVSCSNNSTDKDETPAVNSADTTAPPEPIDTSKMDTASTRPVKTTN